MASPKSFSDVEFITVSRSMAHSTPPFLSKRMLLIFVSLCVTRVGIVPSSTFDQNPRISPRRDSIQPISFVKSFTRPAASRPIASSHCTKRWRMLWNPLIVSASGSVKSANWAWNLPIPSPPLRASSGESALL